jgi:hypothetical protein
VREGFITTGFPVVGRFGLFAQHHRRAMGEKVNWWSHLDVGNVLFLTKRGFGLTGCSDGSLGLMCSSRCESPDRSGTDITERGRKTYRPTRGFVGSFTHRDQYCVEHPWVLYGKSRDVGSVRGPVRASSRGEERVLSCRSPHSLPTHNLISSFPPLSSVPMPLFFEATR